MISCDEVKNQLLHLISGNVRGEQARMLLRHIDRCTACAREKEEIERLWERIGVVEEAEVPSHLRELTLRLIYEEAESVVGALGGLDVRKVLAAVGAGVGVTLLYLVILAGRVDLGRLPLKWFALSVVVWSGLVIFSFCGMLGGYRGKQMNLSLASLFGVAATGLALIGTYLCPEATFFQMWERSPLASHITGVVGKSGGNLLFGILYALPPALLVSGVLGSRLKRGSIIRNGLAAAGVFFALLLPAVYLQCATLMASWGAGALVGAFIGTLSGLGIHRLRARWAGDW